jgi:hypothetical protein
MNPLQCRIKHETFLLPKQKISPLDWNLKKEEKECDYSQEQSQPFSLLQEQLQVQVHLHSLVMQSPPIILS